MTFQISVFPLFRHLVKLRCVLKRNNSSITFEKTYDLHNLKDGPKTTVSVTKDEALTYYKKMHAIRNIEQSCANLYLKKEIRGFCHLYSGQEGTGVGIHAALKPEDTLITAYRCHGFTYLMGATPLEVVSELTGRKTGVAMGKGGSMHMYAKNFFGGNGIVGAQVPLGTGIGFRHKYLGKDAVSFTLYGDGAANQGQVFESFNLAKLFMLPIVYICENNVYAMGTKSSRAAANPDFYTRCEYIPGIRCDGMDVLAVREVARFARDYAASGKGPIIVECKTYRYFGHSMSDPGISYRTREEISEIRNKSDPIKTFRKAMIEKQILTEQECLSIDQVSKEEVAKLEKEATSAPLPTIQDLHTDVYAKCLNCPVRNVNTFKPLKCGTSRTPINLE